MVLLFTHISRCEYLTGYDMHPPEEQRFSNVFFSTQSIYIGYNIYHFCIHTFFH